MEPTEVHHAQYALNQLMQYNCNKIFKKVKLCTVKKFFMIPHATDPLNQISFSKGKDAPKSFMKH